MPPTNIRWELTNHLIGILRGHEHLAGVQIEPGFPGDTQEDESIWVDELDGEIEIPVLSAGRKYRDDQFTIPFQIRVAGLVDLDSTMARLSELVAGIEDPLADDPGLDEFDGVIAAEVSSERMTAGQIRDVGWVGFAEVVISVHARLD